MIRKITDNIVYTNDEKRDIRAIGKMNGDSWDNPTLTNIRDNIKNQLNIAQRNIVFPEKYGFIDCAYCGLIMGGTGRKEVEHIAHKAKHPEFSYHSMNLVFACSHCNGSSKKGQKEVVASKPTININHVAATYFSDVETKYNQTKFKILHPKINNPDTDYRWGDAEKVILLDGVTPEAKKSIEMFDLRDFHMTSERQKQYENEQNYLNDPVRFEKIWEATNNAR